MVMTRMFSGGIVVLALLVGPSTASAQPVAVDVAVGASDSAMSGLEQTFSQPTTLRPAIGLTFGVAVPVRIARWFTFEPEVLFAQKRYVYTTPDTENFGGPLADVSTRLDYLEVPLLARFGANRELAGLYGVAGPAFSVLLDAPFQYDYHAPGRGAGTYDAVGIWFRRPDVSVVAGVGWMAGRLSIEARGDLGVLDVRFNNYYAPHQTPWHTRTVSVLGRYRVS